MRPIRNETFEVTEKALRAAFAQVKAEMDDHREAINANTNELQDNYAYMLGLENKIDKLSERIDELFLMLQSRGISKRIVLSASEQSVFLHLYMSEDFRDVEDVARRLGLDARAVEEAIRSMVTKGVNLTTAYRDSMCYVRLDPHFRDEQAKNGIVALENVQQEQEECSLTRRG